MTIDSVVQKTGITLGLTIARRRGDLVPDARRSDTETGAGVALPPARWSARFGGFALSMVNSFKRVVSPAPRARLRRPRGPVRRRLQQGDRRRRSAAATHGIVVGAVAGTFAAVGGTLAAYKFFNIQVGPTFRKWVVGAMFGFVAVSPARRGARASSARRFGFNGFGPMGLLSSVIGLGLGVLMLILDFDFVERGIAAGLPERESWRAAFGLTVTIIWIYIELLRILAILRGD